MGPGGWGLGIGRTVENQALRIRPNPPAGAEAAAALPACAAAQMRVEKVTTSVARRAFFPGTRREGAGRDASRSRAHHGPVRLDIVDIHGFGVDSAKPPMLDRAQITNA